MGNDDKFEGLRDALESWYTRGDQRAVRRFVETFLSRVVFGQLRALRARVVDADDIAQEVLLRFLDRDARRGDGAEAFAYWRKKIQWLLKDALRSAGRFADTPGAEPFEPDGGDQAVAPGPWQEAEQERRLYQWASVDRAATVVGRLSGMSRPRRTYFLTYFYQQFGPELDRLDFDCIESRSAHTEPQARTVLETAEPQDSSRLVRLFFTEAALDDCWTRCLDTFRKGRRRAMKDIEAALEAGS